MQNFFTIKNKLVIKILLFIAFAIFAYSRTIKENEFGDFHVFWNAANVLVSGRDLYLVENGWRAFYYPPFAAVMFLPMMFFSFKVACFLFFIYANSIRTFKFARTFDCNCDFAFNKYCNVESSYGWINFANEFTQFIFLRKI